MIPDSITTWKWSNWQYWDIYYNQGSSSHFLCLPLIWESTLRRPQNVGVSRLRSQQLLASKGKEFPSLPKARSMEGSCVGISFRFSPQAMAVALRNETNTPFETRTMLRLQCESKSDQGPRAGRLFADILLTDIFKIKDSSILLHLMKLMIGTLAIIIIHNYSNYCNCDINCRFMA